jgi:hypothetical protein
VIRGSFHHLVYDEEIEHINKLSDHCPITVFIDPDIKEPIFLK